jgi:hypothetical protein
VGRTANGFQLFIIGDLSLPYPQFYDSIVRLGEVPAEPDLLRIRNSFPSDPDPVSGGWGSVRGETRFTVEDTTSTFSTPLDLISDHSLNGIFSYDIETYEFGGLTAHARDTSTVVSEPSILPTFLVFTIILMLGTNPAPAMPAPRACATPARQL